MLAGRPLVLIDTELSEVIEPGQSGECAKNTPRDLARVLTSLLQDAERRVRYGARGRQLAMAFTERHQVRKLIELYGQAIDQH